MANIPPPRFVRTAAPNRQAAIGLAVIEAIGKSERQIPLFLRRLLLKLDRAERPGPERGND